MGRMKGPNNRLAREQAQLDASRTFEAKCWPGGDAAKATCAAEDPKRRVGWCVLAPGHPGKHQDSWGKKFAGTEPASRLADLPRFLSAGGNRTLAKIVTEELEKHATARASLTAVLFQMEHGEASDVFDIGVINPDAQRDLHWCRDEIKSVLKSLT